MGYILGVDAGNTKTVALVAHADGTIVGAGRAGCGDIYAAATHDGIPALEEAVLAALGACGARPADIGAGVFSMAGADWPEDFVFIQNAIRTYGFGRAITVYNDAFGALRAGSADGTGVVVVCGTGAATGGRGPDGRIWHTSFWQGPQGGFELGRKALKAVFRAELGIEPPTALSSAVLEFFGQPDVAAVLHMFTARNGARPTQARHLVRVLLDVADRGDAPARQIVREHGAALGEYALVAARQVGIANEPFTLVLAGGVLRHPSPLLAEALVSRVRAAAPQVRVVRSQLEPVIGALLLALEAAGATIGDGVKARLEATMPPAAFFATDGAGDL
jgi:N-acetylglucosamine kinase-like BadF-type ATPase